MYLVEVAIRVVACAPRRPPLAKFRIKFWKAVLVAAYITARTEEISAASRETSAEHLSLQCHIHTSTEPKEGGSMEC